MPFFYISFINKYNKTISIKRNGFIFLPKYCIIYKDLVIFCKGGKIHVEILGNFSWFISNS